MEDSTAAPPKASLVSRMPADILEAIFIIVVQPSSDFAPVSWHHHVDITAVCKHWRCIALESAAFWSCIPIIPCKKLPQMIDRSRTHPLSVRLEVSSGSSLPETWEAQHLDLYTILEGSRLQEFHLREIRDRSNTRVEGVAEPILKHLLAGKANFLRSLKISLRERATLPIQVLNVAKPALRHLHLTTIAIEWDLLLDTNPHIRNLETLVLKYITPRPPQAVLHAILASSPKLERLILSSCLPLDPTPPTRDQIDSISLPDIRVYECHDDSSRSLDFLQWLRIPQHHTSGTLVLWTGERKAPGVDRQARILQLLEIFGISHGNTRSSNYTTMAISVFFGQLDVCLQSVSGNKHHLLSLALPSRDFLILLETIHVPEITQLALHILDQDALDIRDAWYPFFKRHRNVQELRLLSTDILQNYLNLALSPWTVEEGSGVGNEVYPLQNLKSMRLGLMEPGDGDQEELVSILTCRHRAGFTVERLRLHEHQPGFDVDELSARLYAQCGTPLEFGQIMDDLQQS